MTTTAPTSTPATATQTYTSEQKAIIDGLSEAQDILKVSDKKFADNYLKTYSETTWSRIRSGTYQAKDLSKVFQELESSLNSIRRRIAKQTKATQGSRYYELEQFSAMFRAVTDCLEKTGENRLVVYVAPSGAGKSRFLNELAVREETKIVNANEAWATSYFHAALDILTAIGGGASKISGAGEARREMLAQMKGKKILAIGEGNYFGPKSINLVKDVLNETEWTVVLTITPPSFEKMKRFWTEYSQLQRRYHSVFRFSPLTAAQVQNFLSDAGLNGDAEKAALVLARAANDFGAFDMINRVIERLEETCSVSKHPTLADVEKAIAYVKTAQDLPR